MRSTSGRRSFCFLRRSGRLAACAEGRAAITADGEGPDNGSVGLLIRELDPNIGARSTTAIFLTVPGTASQIGP
jgi:hypothetical protein